MPGVIEMTRHMQTKEEKWIHMRNGANNKENDARSNTNNLFLVTKQNNEKENVVQQ